MFIKSLTGDSLLSFAPGTPPLSLEPLNVLIGPNGSGESNLIDVVELLRVTPTAFASAIRDGSSVREGLWKGDSAPNAKIKHASELPKAVRPSAARGIPFQRFTQWLDAAIAAV